MMKNLKWRCRYSIITHSELKIISLNQKVYYVITINQKSIPKRDAERFIVKNTLTERHRMSAIPFTPYIGPKKQKQRRTNENDKKSRTQILCKFLCDCE